MKIASLPKDFVLGLAQKPPRRKKTSGRTFAEGNRNTELTSIAGFLRLKGLRPETIAEALHAINDAACNPPVDDDEVEGIAESIGRYDAEHEDAFRDLADVEEEEIRFILEYFLVRGAVNVLDGHMGLGKSTFTAAIAAAVTTGEPPPFANWIAEGNVLFLSAEDDPSRVLKPRLLAAGANIDRIRFQEKLFTLNRQGLCLLDQEITDNMAPFVIIDPIIAYMDEAIDGNKANETMRFMVELDQIARKHDIAILIVRHLRKSKADTAMHQGVGSIAISARVRSGLMLGIHPDRPELRAVVHTKHNYTKQGPTLIFEICSDKQRDVPRIKWHPADDSITADDLITDLGSGRGRPSDKRDEAKDFLRGALAKGPVAKTELLNRAKERGISPETLRRAADELKVKKSKLGREWVWSLR